MKLRVGNVATRKFVVDASTMEWFREVSQDLSRIHCDTAYARSRGFDGVVVYGGIMLAHLSHLLGMYLPGRNGTSAAWSIKYHGPLYVDEAAEIRLEVTYVSPGTGVVESVFSIMAGNKEVATGTAQSVVPLDEIEVW
jgi:3-hydroxybutyryl-CoA dehydratase